MSGVSIRLGKLFNKVSQRSFVVAFDHGQGLPIPPGLGNPVRLIEKVTANGLVDGLLLTKGMISQAGHVLAHRGAPAAIVRADWTTLDPADKESFGEYHRIIIEPTDALRMGADALCVYLIAGPDNDAMFPDNVTNVAEIIEKSHRIGLPVIVESVLWGSQITNKKDPELLRKVCRQAAELGADALKTEFVGDVAAQRTIIAEVGDIPVLTLGGAPGGDEEVRKAAAGAISAGARGLIFGRNVWQAGDLTERIQSLAEITHAPNPDSTTVMR